MEGGERRKKVGGETKASFHVFHKVPVGDSPYVRAKYLQLVDKDLDASIVWFWKAINSGDRIDSALKDMALVLKQQNRPEEAIKAIRSFRHSCSKLAQESLDNVLIDLYKKCGMIEEQIALLKKKLRMIYTGDAFNGKATKTARSHGKKFQVSIAQETSRVLGNLGWAYMQQGKYKASEAVYLKAQMIDADTNKAYNLSLCLVKQGRIEEARHILVGILSGRLLVPADERIARRAAALLRETELQQQFCSKSTCEKSLEEEVIERISVLLNEWAPLESIFDKSDMYENISPQRDEITC